MVNSFSGKFDKRGKNILPMMLFFPVSLLFQELVTRHFTFGELKFAQFGYIFLFSVSIGFIISFIISLIRSKTVASVVAIAC